MPAPKGSHNAREYQEKLVGPVAERISVALRDLNAKGMSFRNISSIARQISNVAGVSDVSLRRNPRYRALLEKHLNSQKGAASILSPLQQDVPALRARVRLLEMEVSNKQQKIHKLEAALRRVSAPTDSVIARSGGSERVCSSEFLLTANLVLTLVRRGNLSIKPETFSIVDDYAPTGRDVIAGGNIAKPFIEWLVSNKGA